MCLWNDDVYIIERCVGRVAIFTEPDPQGTGRVDKHTHPYTTAACAAGVATKTTDRDNLRYTTMGSEGCASQRWAAKATELN